MTTRKSMTLPIIITFIIIAIIVYLFTTIKQTEIVCSMSKTFDSDIRLTENITTTLDGKKITGMHVIKTIVLPEKFADETHLNSIKYALDNTLEYLGNKVYYTISNDRIVVEMKVDKNEVLLLDNIQFIVNDDLQIEIDSNTKSSNVITLTVGDNYSDGEFMKRLKNNGYRCK
ncbi:MAG: hypothetical protein IJJ63_01880 [Bacilli bacterium]|nr:hypothetical protein [Bacilli bacterium]